LGKEKTVLIDDFRQSTKTERPSGDEGFGMHIEKMLGRKLNALPKERPRRQIKWSLSLFFSFKA